MDGAEKHEVPLSRTQAKNLGKVLKWKGGRARPNGRFRVIGQNEAWL